MKEEFESWFESIRKDFGHFKRVGFRISIEFARIFSKTKKRSEGEEDNNKQKESNSGGKTEQTESKDASKKRKWKTKCLKEGCEE